MAPSAPGSTSVGEIAIGTPRDSTSPSSLPDFEMLDLPNPAAESETQQSQQQAFGPPPESQASATSVEQVDTSSTSNTSITHIMKETPLIKVLNVGGAAGGPASSSSSSASTQGSHLTQFRREIAPEREPFTSMYVPLSAAASPPHASVMSRSAFAKYTPPPSLPLAVSRSIVSPAPVQMQAGSMHSSSQESTGQNSF